MSDELPNVDGLTVRSVLDKRRPDGFQLVNAEAWLELHGNNQLRPFPIHPISSLPCRARTNFQRSVPLKIGDMREKYTATP